MTRLRVTVLALLLALPAAARADEPGAQVAARARLEPAGDAAIGQGVTLAVEVLTTGFFVAGAELPPLEIPGAVVMESADRPLNFSETIAGASWTGIATRFLVTPLREGELTIPELAIVTHPGPGGAPLAVRTQALTVRVAADARPPDARDAVVTGRFELTQEITPDPKALHVGGAVTRRLTLTAAGTPAMMIAPLAPAQVEGLAAYPKAAEVDDRSDPRTSLPIGVRVETTTYVAERAGDFTLPAVEVRWWDPATSTLHTESAPAVALHADSAPAAAPFATPGRGFAIESPGTRTGWLLAALAVAVGAIAWSWPWIRRGAHALRERRTAARARYAASEPAAWSELERALRSRAPDAAQRLYDWIDRVEAVQPKTLEAAMERANDADFTKAGAAFLARYGGERDAGDALGALRRTLPRARRSLRRGPGAHAAGELGPLNL